MVSQVHADLLVDSKMGAHEIHIKRTDKRRCGIFGVSVIIDRQGVESGQRSLF